VPHGAKSMLETRPWTLVTGVTGERVFSPVVFKKRMLPKWSQAAMRSSVGEKARQMTAPSTFSWHGCSPVAGFQILTVLSLLPLANLVPSLFHLTTFTLLL